MLRKFKDLHAGETCIILGNGASLSNAPRELLEAYPSFGANKIFLLNELPGWEGFAPKYYTIIDEKMGLDCSPHLHNFPAEVMFIRRGIPVVGAYPIRMTVEASFSKDINDQVVMGGTVTYANLQIAYYMGFVCALLVGVDHNYGKYARFEPGSAFMAMESDDAHFHPEYFKDGHIYNAPELTGSECMYRLARSVWALDKRRIVNLTPDSKLKIFEQDDYENWMTDK